MLPTVIGGCKPFRRTGDSQIEHLIRHLSARGPHYVLVFIHGWRHDAQIGDTNVAELQSYAAHAARFLADRNSPARVTGVYVGWRGARTDENWLKRNLPLVGPSIGNALAALTLFDRKPVSEAIAPSVLSALRALEATLKLPKTRTAALKENRMIVFGHSLGGNILASALGEDLIKKIRNHKPGDYMLPVLGDLVVLLNPASEATKWTSFQREVWRRVAMAEAERAPVEAYENSKVFFRSDQRPIVVSVTSARNWPPGGARETDCKTVLTNKDAKAKQRMSRYLARTRTVEYDSATHDLFPAFKGDLRPLADTLTEIGSGRDPADHCETSSEATWSRMLFGSFAVGLGAILRVLPFMQTDPEQTRTIGHLDPPRSPRGRSTSEYYFSAKPFGTTHELWDLSKRSHYRDRKSVRSESGRREVSLSYSSISGPLASCPRSDEWLTRARAKKAHDGLWDSNDISALMGEDNVLSVPALRFIHGFQRAGLAAITRGSDPFWNVRAFDAALSRHNGYMLTSFICAMNQFVMDPVTRLLPDTPPQPESRTSSGLGRN